MGVAPEVTAERAVRRPGLVGPVLAWAAVVLVELKDLSLLALLFGPLELAVWLTAVLLTVRDLRRAGLGRLVVGAVAVLLGAACLHFTNWAAFHPESYYATHRYAFAAVADGIHDGGITASPEYYGEPLPPHLRDLSITGKVSVVGKQDDDPVLFLPQWMGFPDDAGGFVHLDGEPRASLELDLYGSPVRMADGIELGDGWWYVPGR